MGFNSEKLAGHFLAGGVSCYISSYPMRIGGPYNAEEARTGSQRVRQRAHLT